VTLPLLIFWQLFDALPVQGPAVVGPHSM